MNAQQSFVNTVQRPGVTYRGIYYQHTVIFFVCGR